MTLSPHTNVTPGASGAIPADHPLAGFITPDGLAKLWTCHPRTIKRMVARHELPRPILIGRKLYFDLELLRQHLHARSAAANTPPKRGRRGAK